MVTPATRLLQRVLRAVRRLLRIDRERRWNRQYAEGAWEWLHALDELAHHVVLAAYFRRLAPNGRVLDVGCGSGLFHEQLYDRPYARYLGVDFEEPVRQASVRVDDKTRFIVADMNDFVPDEEYDAIVFDESIYYLWDPVAGLEPYANALAPNGVLLISMHGKKANAARWRAIETRYRVLDAVTVTNQSGTSWTVKALAPDGLQSTSRSG